MRRFLIDVYDKERVMVFVKEKYSNNDNLAIVVMSKDEEEDYYEQWCMLTVNLNTKLPNNQAYLDTNNCSREIIDFFYRNNFVTKIGVGFSGFCTYPLVEFSEEFMSKGLTNSKEIEE